MGLHNIKILQILIICIKIIESTRQNSTTTETFINNTGNSTKDDYIYEGYEESEFAQKLEKIEIWCWKIMAPTFLVVGVVGNTLSILVLRR